MSKDTNGRSKLNLGREEMTTEAERDCKHGQLARSCNVCELEAEVERQAAEIEHLKFALNQESLARENVSQMRAEFASKLDRSEALLRQALDAMQWEVGGEPLPTLMMESIAAIKQHLGEV